MRAIVAATVLTLASAGAAAAQDAAPAAPAATGVLAQAAVCLPGPETDGIAARASQSGWAELPRRDALRLQALADKSALVRAWRLGPPEASAYLLVQTPDTPRPRRLTCEILFQAADPQAVQADLVQTGFGDALGPPRLQGALPAGGRYAEWAAPDGSPWRLITLSTPLPPKRGPTLNRLGFSGVER